MFLTETFDINQVRPADSGISVNDWTVLSRYWYPVAVDGDVKDKPLKGKLLDVELVIYRVEGKVAVARDLCPHRHIRLSAGEIANDRLVCPFHGMAFDGTGQCTKVPALGRDAKLPPSYRLRSFRSEVRYGLVWACLDNDSNEEIPDFEAAAKADVENRIAFGSPLDWPVSAAHQLENFIDLAHIPFVHQASMGGDPDAAAPAAKTSRTNRGLEYGDLERDRRFPDGTMKKVDGHYTIMVPFMVELKSKIVGDTDYRLFMYNLATPITAHTSRVFMMFITPGLSPSRESHAPGGEGAMESQGAMIVREDLELLVELGQPNLPLDARSEIHLPCDKVSIEYRKMLSEAGLGRA